MFTVVAVVVGVAIGLATGGKVRNLANRSFRHAWLLVIGVVLQVVTEVFHLAKTPDYALVLISYAALAAFALSNLRLAGMGVVAFGLALNIAPIAINHGMPVRASAIVEAQIARRDQVATLDFGGKRHLQGPHDHLTVLGDILPDWIFREVLSFGDLVMAVGIADVFVHLLRTPRRRLSAHHPSGAGGTSAGPVADPPSGPPTGATEAKEANGASAPSGATDSGHDANVEPDSWLSVVTSEL